MGPQAIFGVALTVQAPSCHSKDATSSAEPLTKQHAAAQGLTQDLLPPKRPSNHLQDVLLCAPNRYIKYLLVAVLQIMDPIDGGPVRFHPLAGLYLSDKQLQNHQTLRESKS